jgi:hypothetical protein
LVAIKIPVGWVCDSPEGEKATKVGSVDTAVEVEVTVQQFAGVEFAVLVFIFGSGGDVAGVGLSVQVAIDGSTSGDVAGVDASRIIAIQGGVGCDLADIECSGLIAVQLRNCGGIAGI